MPYKDPEKRREYQRQWREQNREKLNAYRRQYMREYRKKYPERIKANTQRFRERHKERLREEAREYNHKFRIQILERLGSKCVVCGFDDWRALQIDHINGRGTEETKKLGVYGFYTKIRDMPLEEAKKEYQVLCANHNWIKRHENKEFPNMKEEEQ